MTSARLKQLFKRQPATTTKERIVQATLEEIERGGIPALTVRKVAAAAEVNVAAINYYFGSKAALVATVLDAALAHMLADVDRYLDRIDKGLEIAWEDLFVYWFEGNARYPRTTKAHLCRPFAEDDYTGPFPARFRPVMQRMATSVLRAVPGLTRRQAESRVIRAVSAVLFPSVFLGMFAGMGEAPGAYVKGLVAELLR